MENPLAADRFPRTFDLGAEATYVRRQTVNLRAAGATVGAVIVAIGAIAVLASHSNVIAGVPLFVFGGAFLVLAYATRSPIPPSRLTIGPTGLELRYTDGSQRFLAWTDPSLAFRVIDRSADSTASHEERVHLAIEFADGHSGTIPKATLLALDDAAVEFRVARLARREMERQGKTWVVRQVVRFGDPTQTPHWSEAREVPPGSEPPRRRYPA